MNENIFDKLDFGPFRPLLDNDDITDISYDNNGQIWVRSLTQGSLRVEVEGATPDFVEKLAFQCSNVMGTTFNNAKPFLDAESAELRMNFVHQSIATNGIALVIRKTPAKIRLEKDKLIQEDYFTPAVHDFLIKCVQGHCNIMVAGETGSGKTEFVKYLASHTKTNEKIITIEDTLELHLDRIFPQRDIVAMKTNNVASYSDVLVTCMRQNPKWILLSEVRSAEAVSAVRNSISSGHNILSTIHADKASAIPYRLYSLMETDLDVHQFLTTIYRYIQLGVHIKAFYSKEYGKFHRELDEVAEFYVDDNNVPQSRIIYQKVMGHTMMCKPSAHMIEYLENQNIDIQDIIKDLPEDLPITDGHVDLEEYNRMMETSGGEKIVIESKEEKSEGAIQKVEKNEDEKKEEEKVEQTPSSVPATILDIPQLDVAKLDDTLPSLDNAPATTPESVAPTSVAESTTVAETSAPTVPESVAPIDNASLETKEAYTNLSVPVMDSGTNNVQLAPSVIPLDTTSESVPSTEAIASPVVTTDGLAPAVTVSPETVATTSPAVVIPTTPESVAPIVQLAPAVTAPAIPVVNPS